VLTYAKATVIRAIVVSVFGISVGVFDSHGVVLLCSTPWLRRQHPVLCLADLARHVDIL